MKNVIGLTAAVALILIGWPSRGAETERDVSAAASQQAAAVSPTVGLNVHTFHWREPYVIDHVERLGIDHIRITGVLQLWEGEEPSYRAYMRETAAEAEAAGVRLLWVLHNTRGDVFGADVDSGWWERMIRFAEWTARLPAVEGVQLWNEQDLWVQAPFGAADGLPMRERGRHYADFLRLAYPRIKAAAPDVLVVTGGTADHPGSGFLAGMMESSPPVDVVAIHAYGPWGEARDRIAAARAIAGDHTVWVTESGSRHHTVDERTQLADWRSTVEGNEREQLAARLYLYALDAGSERGHSLLDSDHSPRAAYHWLRDRGGDARSEPAS